jgi:hypothetical protein
MTPDLDFGGAISGALVGIGGLAGAVLYVRRQLSKDQTVIAEDKADRARISRQEAEIDRLTKALAKQTHDADEMSALRSENRFLTLERDRLLRDIKRAVRGLSPQLREVLETDFAALADVEERIEPGTK